MKNILLKTNEISSFSFCEYEKLISKMNDKDIEKINLLCTGVKTVIFMLIPYYAGDNSGNISKYARGRDYHRVSAEISQKIIKQFNIKYPANHFIHLCDASPIPEVYGSYISGLGALGKNKLIIDDKYGSYVFISSILTDLETDYTSGAKECINCQKCIKACPTGFLSGAGRCLSDITQTNDEITEGERKLLKNSLVWGCDICSDVCPMNKNILYTTNDEFSENLIYNLTLEDINNLTRKQFNAKYQDRAFTFRGANPLIRNLKIKEDK